jgi:hypothetical protein
LSTGTILSCLTTFSSDLSCRTGWRIRTSWNLVDVDLVLGTTTSLTVLNGSLGDDLDGDVDVGDVLDLLVDGDLNVLDDLVDVGRVDVLGGEDGDLDLLS